MRKQELFSSINPTTETILAEYPALSEEELRSKVKGAAAAFQDWSQTSITHRADLLKSLKTELLSQRDDFAKLMTLEMGKPILQARAEIEKCAGLCDYYRTHGPQFLAPETVTGNTARKSYVRFDPLGPVLAVMPWNFPCWQVLRFAIPGLLAGNVCVLKHATNVLGSAARIEEIFLKAGYPAGVFCSLNTGRQSILPLISSNEIKAVTLTGSELAGRAVAEAAGRHLKKCVLELGGSDPFIVLPGVDIETTAQKAVEARTMNNGQSCIAAKRFIVHDECYDEFVDAMTAQMKSLTVGDPLDESSAIGPLARKDLRDTLHQQVRSTVKEGGKLLTGGKPVDRKGWFYEPTVFSDVSPQMTAFREELFGPVAPIIKAADADEAVALANQSSFGLGSSIWTKDIEQAEKLAARIESGCVFINQVTMSDASVPFGGIKNSGYGRELGEAGIREFVNMKTVWIG
ncbi:NAD-dependent succinate-semialdehyde dehydrogenase [Planctomicrobium piriforme]|uniref:Succinate-semialdehyde dehydrogenase / glutarate-semialdehyde dehydrogenase n=1 Tax=Planctomicrobium piriforme TaxID=1576369 RepID=A0A1I3F3N5_9PLAN|nr:NAD-dependent succinate-semialdehyde dehydrogenase [Planctomicrobium piriforme]SFI05808.1 succinate-semialdehyde dehydrogenase / glutarate-semialdehyde dehydrogenase [Planctomicrobium piriforme]